MMMANELNELKKNLKSGRVIIGTGNTLKKLKNNKLDKIWLSSNVPATVKDDVVTVSYTHLRAHET